MTFQRGASAPPSVRLPHVLDVRLAGPRRHSVHSHGPEAGSPSPAERGGQTYARVHARQEGESNNPRSSGLKKSEEGHNSTWKGAASQAGGTKSEPRRGTGGGPSRGSQRPKVPQPRQPRGGGGPRAQSQEEPGDVVLQNRPVSTEEKALELLPHQEPGPVAARGIQTEPLKSRSSQC